MQLKIYTFLIHATFNWECYGYTLLPFVLPSHAMKNIVWVLPKAKTMLKCCQHIWICETLSNRIINEHFIARVMPHIWTILVYRNSLHSVYQQQYTNFHGMKKFMDSAALKLPFERSKHKITMSRRFQVAMQRNKNKKKIDLKYPISLDFAQELLHWSDHCGSWTLKCKVNALFQV